MTDIVERLRSPKFADVAEKYLMREAADEIERLQRECERWARSAEKIMAEAGDEIERMREAALTVKSLLRGVRERNARADEEIKQLRAATSKAEEK